MNSTTASPTIPYNALSLRQSAHEERRAEVIQLVSHYCRKWFTPHGEWIHPIRIDSDGAWINGPKNLPHTYTRMAFWLTMGLMDGKAEDVSQANAILERAPFSLGTNRNGLSEGEASFDIFLTNHAMQMLRMHESKLLPSVRTKLEHWARAALRDYQGDRQADLQFHGFNDNMPAKATLGLVLGGEYFNDDDALEHGIWNLHQLADILTRRGLISEYNSPTYTPFTLVNLTVISEYAKSREARELASKCCERVWADILAHFHRHTGIMGGPFSRAYHFDSTAHLSTQSFLLWLALDDRVLPNPIEEFEKDPVELLHAHGFAPESLSRLSWVASSKLVPPPYLLKWAQSREYPFELHATAERGGGNEKYCSEVNITQYQEEDFSLGTAEAECWSQHQSEVFYLTYRKHSEVKSRKDVGVAYTRYLINDEVPVDPNESLASYGSLHTLQDKRTALILARPTLELQHKEITKLRLCLIIPEHFGLIERVEQYDGHVFIEDGSVRYSIRALNPSDWGGSAEIKVERIDDYLLIVLENYSGDARKFTAAELERTLNGFVFSITTSEEESQAEFQQRILAAQCLDYWHFGTRTLHYQNEQTRLKINYAPGSDHVRYASIGGNALPKPIWKAEGLPAEELPFLGTSPERGPLKFPYKHLQVSYDPEASWCINSHPSGQPAHHGPGWRKGK
ncbi:hypothetical protein [Puniceicoccus vermicola]|uniref:Alginate lyase domain-containing protein n=1 Tax=Puniceicoccus vermicola TaxID=388746 RepID=A0A7X1AZC6_9BACT|nr:hypothetical protein [Puniceicoccus vermicola]MBC2602770.1 hypothetical protein [Puniceicoccus vermicola]